MEHLWQATQVSSPRLEQSVRVTIAKDIPYVSQGNRLETLSIYVPINQSTRSLVGTAVRRLPIEASAGRLPRYQVHIHGGAWRDPNLLSSSIEATVAHAFSDTAAVDKLDAIISLNYTLASFPTHPTMPYDPVKNNHSDPAREAVHPKHIQDILHAFHFLHALGLSDDSYILSGHSAGACLAFQAALFDAEHWTSKSEALEIPRPAALLGMNGLYGLPELVHHLGASHAAEQAVYADLLQIAFGDEAGWSEASPAHVKVGTLKQRIASGRAPKLIVVDQSRQDQLVPLNQMQMMKSKLSNLEGLQVVEGKRCTGTHASPWEQGYMIWDNIKDILDLLLHAS